MRIKNTLASFLVIFSIGTQSMAQHYTPANDSVSTVSGVPEIRNIEYKYFDGEEKSVSEEIREISENANSTVIFSANDNEVLFEGAKVAEQVNRKGKRFFILPYGKAVNDEVVTSSNDPAVDNKIGKILKGIKAAPGRLSGDDKMGFIVATMALGAESYSWIHSDNFSTIEKTAAIMFSIGTGLVFALDKDAWAKHTRPFQVGIRKMFNMSPEITDDKSSKDLAVKIFASASLAFILNEMRVPLVNIDEIANHVFDAKELIRPVFVSLATAFAATAWLETIASIKKDKDPKAKFIARRTIEVRSVLMSAFAGSALLFNFQEHGLNPWIVLAVSGVSGITIYKNSEKLTELIESSPKVERLFRYGRNLLLSSGLRKSCLNILEIII